VKWEAPIGVGEAIAIMSDAKGNDNNCLLWLSNDYLPRRIQ
jgi:hypothetical protein